VTKINLSKSHRRWNPLLQEWVLVSPHRSQRPWDGAIEKVLEKELPEYDSKCYLCPGNLRANGEINSNYKSVFAFDNDFPALMQEITDAKIFPQEKLSEIIKRKQERGICRVICFSPKHNLTLPEMDVKAIRKVIDLWIEEFENLARKKFINYILIFENKGQIMGCSNPHPHGQIWATQSIPNIPTKSISSQESYFSKHKKKLLNDYLNWELKEKKRIISQNKDWVVLVPFWAIWPFETMVLPRRSIQSISELTEEEKNNWAKILKDITIRYDNLFRTSFPYSMGIYQKPTDDKEYKGFQLYQVFLPPLLRSATIKKFMVGYELCAEPQRDITPEQAAVMLRSCSTKHYRTEKVK